MFQLFDAIRLKDNSTRNNYKCTAKTHSTMDKKFLIPLYAEHLKFLMERCFWKVTKIYQHFTFQQEMFKKGFVVSNQVARQNAKMSMEKNFYKLMNNANFGYDCHNNFDNRYFTAKVDELEEMAYARKHQNVYDSEIINDFSPDHLRMQINEDFDNKIAKIGTQDQYYEAKKNSLETERKKQLDSIESLTKKRVKNHKKHLFKEVDELVEDLEQCKNTKTIHEFYPCHTASIKALGVKEHNKIGPSTRFSTGKMLTFVKLSLMSFIYELSELFMFPFVKTKAIYDMYSIDFVYVYQLLTDTDSKSLQFVFFFKRREQSTRENV